MAEQTSAGTSSTSATSSVSKGCFLFNARSNRKHHVLTGSFEKLPGERVSDVRVRHDTFTSCWTAVKEKIAGIMSMQHDKVSADLLEFIRSAHRQLNALHENAQRHTNGNALGFLPPRLEIPTAALIAGVNMPDHGVLFAQLKDRVHAQISPHVVLLRSKDCNAGMKATTREVLRQLMLHGDQPHTLAADSDDEAVGAPTQKATMKLPLPSMSVLCSWYKEASIRKRKQSTDFAEDSSSGPRSRPPVLVVIEDFEGFVPQILQDLIMSFSPYLPQFPVVLVLGVATSLSAIHRTLHRSTTSLLCMEQFQAQHSALTLGQVISEVFLVPSLPFKLSAKSFQFLLHQFFYCNLSLINFTRGIQCAMMEHFYWQPLSVMCVEQDKVSQTVDKLSHLQCEMTRATPSFQRYVESLPPERQLSLLENDQDLKVELKQLLTALNSYHKSFYLLLECLFHLTAGLPNSLLGKQVHELYLLCLEAEVTKHSNFQASWTILRVLGRNEISNALSKCIGVLERAESEQNGCPAVISDALSTLKEFAEELDQLDQQPLESSGGGGGGAVPVVEETTGERKMRFQERLRQLAARRKEPNEYEKIRSRLLDFLLELFRTHLLPPHTIPLHEVCYFDNASSLRKHLAAAPRVTIQMALTRPTYYLPVVGEDASMPDVCIAHQLHLECGRLINLYDWMQAFITVVQPEAVGTEGEGTSTKKKKQEVDPILHARFIQAVSELQFLGFVKPTQRKTDHVQRLTWGAC